MELKKKEIIICLGSSCFARGNKKMVKVIDDYLKSHQLTGSVHFRGERCFDQCSRGPSIKIDGKLYEKIDEKSITDLLDELFS